MNSSSSDSELKRRRLDKCVSQNTEFGVFSIGSDSS